MTACEQALVSHCLKFNLWGNAAKNCLIKIQVKNMSSVFFHCTFRHTNAAETGIIMNYNYVKLIDRIRLGVIKMTNASRVKLYNEQIYGKI